MAATLPCFAKGNVVTQWKTKYRDEVEYYTFYSDKTWNLIAIDEDGYSEELEEGTYSGDTTKSGKISMVIDGTTVIGEIVGDLMKFGESGIALTLTKVK